MFFMQVKQRKGRRRGELLFHECEPQEVTWAYHKLELCVQGLEAEEITPFPEVNMGKGQREVRETERLRKTKKKQTKKQRKTERSF